MQTISSTIYSSSEDGTILKIDADYNICHDATSGDIKEDTATYIVIGYGNWPAAGGHLIYRSFLFFDTSSIPSNAKITSASLYLKYDDDNSVMDEEFNVVIQDGQPDYPHSPIVLGDYNCSHYHNNGGSIASTSVYGEEYSAIILNSNGRNWINKGGTTKLCLRASIDIEGTSWAIEGHYAFLAFYASERGTGYLPYLTITYTINEVDLINGYFMSDGAKEEMFGYFMNQVEEFGYYINPKT